MTLHADRIHATLPTIFSATRDCLLCSRWDSIGADEEDEDPNLANLDPEQRNAMKAKVKNMEGMLEAMRGGDMASVRARLAGSAGSGTAAVPTDHADPAIAAIIAEPAVKVLLDRCVVRSPSPRRSKAALLDQLKTSAVLCCTA